MDEIVIFEGADLTHLQNFLGALGGAKDLRTLRFCVEDGHLKVKANGGAWSPPLGRLDPNCRAARPTR
jgi:hypothetical protein